jgi:hypothetical protein
VFYFSAVPRRPLVADVLNRTAGKGSRGEHVLYVFAASNRMEGKQKNAI